MLNKLHETKEATWLAKVIRNVYIYFALCKATFAYIYYFSHLV